MFDLAKAASEAEAKPVTEFHKEADDILREHLEVRIKVATIGIIKETTINIPEVLTK